MVEFSQTGNFSKLTNWLQRAKGTFHRSILDKYGQRGVQALMDATPVDTGTTAASWRYKTTNTNGVASIEFYNDNIVDGVNIAIVLQYDHVTGTGGYVKGIDYINPALEPIFKELAREAWEEVKRV